MLEQKRQTPSKNVVGAMVKSTDGHTKKNIADFDETGMVFWDQSLEMDIKGYDASDDLKYAMGDIEHYTAQYKRKKMTYIVASDGKGEMLFIYYNYTGEDSPDKMGVYSSDRKLRESKGESGTLDGSAKGVLHRASQATGGTMFFTGCEIEK